MKALSSLLFWRNKTAVVPVVRLSGVIAASYSLGRRGLSLESVEPQLKKAFATKHAKAVALLINSPGGSPVQSSLIGRRIRQLAAQSNVPVIAFCEDVAASGGYWLAAAADEIFANPASVIGSIGVVSAGFGFDKVLDRIGVERRVYTAGDAKMTLDPFQPEREDEVNRLKSLQTEIHGQFITHIESRRGSRLKGDRKDLFSGAFWTGQAALDLGLVDGMGDCRQVITERFGEDARFVMIEPKRKLFSLSSAGVSAQTDRNLCNEVVALAIEHSYFARYGL
jgi:signal peptide peptidase SppA